MVKKATLGIVIFVFLIQIVLAQNALEIKLSEFVNSHSVDFQVSAPPNSKLNLYVNGEIVRVISEVSQTGIVIFSDVTLPEDENQVKITLSDGSETEKTVKIDTKPPILTIDLPETSTSSKVTLKGKTDEEVELKIKIYKSETEFEEKNLTANLEFNVELDLPVEKTTTVEITATDKAGNTAKETKKVLVDIQPPQILEDNAAQLTPSYDKIVTLRGKISEKAQINIYINDELEKAGALTDSNGNFAQEIELKRTIEVKKDASKKTVEIESATEWNNKIRIEAVDLAGRKTEKVSEVKYSLCGSGGDFRINWEKPSPTILNPRLMLQGIQTFGIPFNITYTGNYDFSFVGQPSIYPLLLSEAESEKYDEEWVQVNPMFEFQKNDVLGYAQVQFTTLKGLVGQKKDTDYKREKNVSIHRKGKECLVPGFGCVRFYLMGEIKYQKKIPRMTFDPRTSQRLENFDLETKSQKFCNKVEVSIDAVRPEFNLPSKRLQSTIEKVQTVIDGIDAMLKPLETVGQALFYGCMGSSLASWGTQIYETYACEGSWVKDLAGGGFNADVARAGLCDAVYDKSGDENTKKSNSACNTCQSAVERNRKLDYKVVRPICERVAGVSAPTLQNYLRNTKDELRPIEVGNLDVNSPIGSAKLSDYKVGTPPKVYVGSDCALKAEFKQDNYNDVTIPAGIDRVREIYTNSQDKVKNAKCDPLLRPAHPDCCGAEYTREWGETCGVRSLGLDTFDELKESACLAEQKEGSNTLQDGKPCNKLWNAVAGFCDKAGQPMPEQIPTGVRLNANNAPRAIRDDMIYLVVIPKGPGGVTTAEGVVNYDIKVSYVADTAELAALPTNLKSANSVDANIKTKYMFFEDAKDIFFAGGKLKNEKDITDTDATTLKGKVCSDVAAQSDCSTITVSKVKSLLTSIRNIVGTPDKEYIIQPDANLLTSARCVYLPGITGWLNRWKQILTHANVCFKTIQTTGDGSPGACQEFLSAYVCDFVFDMARCFTQKYSEGGGTLSFGGGGIGDILGAITKGTTITQQRMRARYGETAMFKSLFVERKLQHAMCAAAFGLPYDLDVEALYKETIPEIPIPSQAMLFPCKRRFAGYNPVSIEGQKGLTTWIYETTAFIAPGSDLRWWLELKCSTGYKCEAKDGFKNGECDCNKLGQEKIMPIRPQETPKDTLSKDEIFDQKLSYVVQTSDASGAKVRYDRAILHWESTDPKIKSEMKTGQAECYIQLTGGDAPAFCSFDPIAGSYLCKFGQQQGSVDITGVKQKYINGKDKFYLNEQPTFDVTIAQNYPSELRNKPEEKKYLSWELKNEVGELKAQGTVSEPLATDGTYTKKIDIEDVVINNNFATNTGGMPFTVTDNQKRVLSALNFRAAINNIRFFESGRELTSSNTAQIKFFKKSDGVYFTVDRDADPQDYKLSEAEYNIKRTAYVLSGGTVDYELKFNIINSQFISDAIDRNNDLIVTINNDKGRDVNPCEGSSKPTKNWQIIFKVFDAGKNGEATTRVSINPKNGNPVTFSIGFDVVCDEAAGAAVGGGVNNGGTVQMVKNKALQILSGLNNKNPSSIVMDVGENKYIITSQESVLNTNTAGPTVITTIGDTLADKAFNVLFSLNPSGVTITTGQDKYIVGLDSQGKLEAYKSINNGAPEQI